MFDPTFFIIDDDRGVRTSIRELVLSVGLAAETFDSAQAYLDAFDPARPGCLVLDVRMARMSGLALQARLVEMQARIPIVFISGHGDIGMAVDAIKRRAVDFVQKPYQEQRLLDAINDALEKDRAQRAAPGCANLPEGPARALDELTERQREILALAIEGSSSKVIATKLGISYRTVELHRSRLIEKLNVHSIAEFARLMRTPRR